VEKNSTAEALVAPDDLPDPGVVETHQLPDFPKREPVLLRLRESFAPCFPSGFRIALELPLCRFYGFTGS
jgi:hypothetical protein